LGKFDTYALVFRLAAPVIDILMLIGHRGLLGPYVPVRHPAMRRCIKTVPQQLMYRAGRLVRRGRRMVLVLAANDRVAHEAMHLHAQFAPKA
jgi:hypothetical protein